MNIHVSDSQEVAETEHTLFEVLRSGPTDMMVILKNVGINTVNYRFQEHNGTKWVDMGLLGTDFYNTIMSRQVRTLKVNSQYPQVRLVGNASGGAILEFSVTRDYDRQSGGPIPILSL